MHFTSFFFTSYPSWTPSDQILGKLLKRHDIIWPVTMYFNQLSINLQFRGT